MVTELRPGDVVDYPYLWAWQDAKGETEGRKGRPVCLVISFPGRSGTVLVLLAITATPPGPDDIAIEIPAMEARRIGLADGKHGWVIVSEANFDSLENSWYLEPNRPARDRFSSIFLSKISVSLENLLKTGNLRKVRRSE